MSTTLVIARYAEELGWLFHVPDDIRIVIYDKGSVEMPPEILRRAHHVEPRRNYGREAETYLHHCITNRTCDDDGFTIFCQGGPIPHSPDFLELLGRQDEWADIQPLTAQWLAELCVPPSTLVERETGENLGELRVRSELFSLHHWNAIRFLDEGAVRIGKDYLSGQGQPQGTNIAAHFLASAGWHELAEQAALADFGQYAYGAIFAVRNELLRRIPEDVLRRLHMMSRSHPLYPWIFERLWLHLFGLPFHPAIQRHSGNILPKRAAAQATLSMEAAATCA